MGGGGEFDLIRSLVGPDWTPPYGVRIGPGDDCAVLGGGVVASTDMAVEGVHFRFDWVSREEAGYRAAAAALSDLAAVAAEPLGVLLSMALPGTEPAKTAKALQAGIDHACERQGTRVLGGDLARSPDRVVLGLTVLGRTEEPVLRSGVRPGHEIWVTGRLGGSAAAVELWESGQTPSPELRADFASPQPRIREALWLAERVPLGGLIDLSDGLAGDAGHLAAASGVSIHLDPAAIPLHPGLPVVSGDHRSALDLALGGGEDFELCLSVPPGSLDDWLEPFQESFGLSLAKVGSAVEGEGVWLAGEGGESLSSVPRGFNHFDTKEAE
jgi:thiamine-monophosphate kinase